MVKLEISSGGWLKILLLSGGGNSRGADGDQIVACTFNSGAILWGFGKWNRFGMIRLTQNTVFLVQQAEQFSNVCS